jgi:hypothetical protein
MCQGDSFAGWLKRHQKSERFSKAIIDHHRRARISKPAPLKCLVPRHALQFVPRHPLHRAGLGFAPVLDDRRALEP